MSSDVDSSQSQPQVIRDEIADLERRLEDAKARLSGRSANQDSDAISSVPNLLPSDGIC
jgi:hypothetical protein